MEECLGASAGSAESENEGNQGSSVVRASTTASPELEHHTNQGSNIASTTASNELENHGNQGSSAASSSRTVSSELENQGNRCNNAGSASTTASSEPGPEHQASKRRRFFMDLPTIKEICRSTELTFTDIIDIEYDLNHGCGSEEFLAIWPSVPR